MAQGDKTAVLSPLRLLFRASQRADRHFTRALGRLQLSPRQLAVLQAVAAADGLSQTAIMAATGLDRSSTADLVRRLVDRGWLRRRRTPHDSRVYAVRLTPKGNAMLALGLPAARAADRMLLQSIAPAQRSAVLGALQLMADS
jgi:DNA-binding MarR family transcriptional regulator